MPRTTPAASPTCSCPPTRSNTRPSSPSPRRSQRTSFPSSRPSSSKRATPQWGDAPLDPAWAQPDPAWKRRFESAHGLPGRPFRLLPDDAARRIPDPGGRTPKVRLSARAVPAVRRWLGGPGRGGLDQGWPELANGLGFDPRGGRAARREEPVGEVPSRRRRRLRGRRRPTASLSDRFAASGSSPTDAGEDARMQAGLTAGELQAAAESAQGSGDGSRDDPGRSRGRRVTFAIAASGGRPTPRKPLHRFRTLARATSRASWPQTPGRR